MHTAYRFVKFPFESFLLQPWFKTFYTRKDERIIQLGDRVSMVFNVIDLQFKFLPPFWISHLWIILVCLRFMLAVEWRGFCWQFQSRAIATTPGTASVVWTLLALASVSDYPMQPESIVLSLAGNSIVGEVFCVPFFLTGARDVEI